MDRNNDLVETTGRCAGLLSVIEIGLGSILHGFKIPMTGFFLSLNQGFFLARAVIQTKNRRLPFLISNVVAILKSLSPAGQRLTPMLAISAQGGFFSLGTILFGPNFFGILIGYWLLSLWSFVQPILIYYFIFGKTILEAAVHFKLTWVLIPLIVAKLLLAFVLCILAHRLSEATVGKYEARMISASRIRHPDKKTQSHLRGALKDISNPFFLASLALTAVFFFVIEATTAQTVWALLRPIAVGFILFYIMRVSSLERLITRLETIGFNNFSNSLRRAVETVKKI